MMVPSRPSMVVFSLALLLALGAVSHADQEPAAPYAPKQSDRPAPATGDEPGFQAIFDGKTLTGWEGNPTYWRVENGALVGEITPDTVIKSNTFIIWRGGRPRDFDLKLEYRITAGGNSGINYRSAQVPDPVTPANKFAMKGYQFDIDGRKQYSGNNYEEKGRLFLALRGQLTRRRRARQTSHGRLEHRPHHDPRQHAHPHPQRSPDVRRRG
jgi:hypothetical protein